jgi:hypothetical protein
MTANKIMGQDKSDLEFRDRGITATGTIAPSLAMPHGCDSTVFYLEPLGTHSLQVVA